jgi:hypothetical protein
VRQSCHQQHHGTGRHEYYDEPPVTGVFVVELFAGMSVVLQVQMPM